MALVPALLVLAAAAGCALAAGFGCPLRLRVPAAGCPGRIDALGGVEPTAIGGGAGPCWEVMGAFCTAFASPETAGELAEGPVFAPAFPVIA